MLRTSVMYDLRTAPTGPCSVTEAACALETAPTKITAMVLDGRLQGRVESGRVVSVDRASVLRELR